MINRKIVLARLLKTAQQDSKDKVFVSSMEMMGSFMVFIKTVNIETSEITDAKTFRGTQDKAVEDAKAYLAQIKTSNPTVTFDTTDLKSPLTPQMLGL